MRVKYGALDEVLITSYVLVIKRSNEAAKGDIFHVSSNSPPLMCSLCWNVKGWLCIHNWLRVIWAASDVCVYVCVFFPEVGNDGWRHQWDLAHHPSDHTTPHTCVQLHDLICSGLIYIIIYMETFHLKPAFVMHHNSMLYALWFLYTTHCAALFCNHIAH